MSKACQSEEHVGVEEEPNRGRDAAVSANQNTLPQKVEPSPADIKLGRGKGCYLNPGNRRLREIIDLHTAQYAATTERIQKAAIRDDIIRTTSQEGRFLRYDDGVEGWVEADIMTIDQKVGQAIRHKLRTGPGSMHTIPEQENGKLPFREPQLGSRTPNSSLEAPAQNICANNRESRTQGIDAVAQCLLHQQRQTTSGDQDPSFSDQPGQRWDSYLPGGTWFGDSEISGKVSAESILQETVLQGETFRKRQNRQHEGTSQILVPVSQRVTAKNGAAPWANSQVSSIPNTLNPAQSYRIGEASKGVDQQATTGSQGFQEQSSSSSKEEDLFDPDLLAAVTSDLSGERDEQDFGCRNEGDHAWLH